MTTTTKKVKKNPTRSAIQGTLHEAHVIQMPPLAEAALGRILRRREDSIKVRRIADAVLSKPAETTTATAPIVVSHDTPVANSISNLFEIERRLARHYNEFHL